MYHNTGNAAGQMLIVFENKANSQEEEILRMFKSNNEFTPSQIWNQRFKGRNVPITSVRRAITNLTNENVLIKTDRKRTGEFNRPESIYQFNLS